jgi:tetratricopeptide (TPR) repeat protein
VALHDDVAGLYLEVGRPDKAIAHFTESARLAPGSAAAHFNLGVSLTIAGRTDEAVDRYRQALAIRPDYALAHNNLGSVLLQQGDADGARLHVREAVRIDPGNAEAQDNLGRISRDRGDVADAIEHFRQAIRLRPNWAAANADLAWTLATSREDSFRDAARAVQLAEHAAALTERRDPAILDVLAAAYAAAGDFDRAIAVSESALRLGPPPVGAAAIRARQALYRRKQPYRRP